MARNNLRQAEVPRGATVIPQVRGTAPGLICRLGDRSIYAVPGVPAEMREMVERAVIPDLVARAGVTATIRQPHPAHLGPGRVDPGRAAGRPAGRPRRRAGTGPTIAFLASGIEGIKVRITAKAATREATPKRCSATEEAAIRGLLGPAVFGVDDESMEAAVGKLLLGAGLTLGLAESLTGGLVGSRLSAVPGAVRVVPGLDRRLRQRRQTEAARRRAMARWSARRRPGRWRSGAAAALGADVGLALTGVAGPTEQDGQPVGTVWVGLAPRRRPEAHLPAPRRRPGPDPPDGHHRSTCCDAGCWTDPTRPDSTRPDPTRPDPTRPDPTRPDPTRPDPTRPDPTPPDPTPPDPTPPERPTTGTAGPHHIIHHRTTFGL